MRAGDWVLVAGTTALGADGGIAGGASPYGQAQEILRKIGAALEAVGGALEQVVQTRSQLTDAAAWEEVGRAHGEAFADVRPVATMVEVAALLDPRMLVEIEAVAWAGG
ncbi:MAG: Rid family hydrolase [Actinomycetota bacterium]|nr:Rid family hydrolase [Actinomycetota bacterium]